MTGWRAARHHVHRVNAGLEAKEGRGHCEVFKGLLVKGIR